MSRVTMPAESGDPLSSALQLSLSSARGSRCGDLDLKIVSNAKQILFSEVKYEKSKCFNTTILDELKAKYLVLNTIDLNSVKSDQVSCTKESVGVEFGASQNNVVKVVKDSVTLPSPKKILYSPDAIRLGWSGHVPVGSGFVNLGNTCYLNSTLQALFHVPAFVNWLLSDTNHSSKCESMNGMTHSECLICAMSKTLQSSQKCTGSVVKPLQIFTKLKLICKHLNHGHQEDAHEFLRYLIEGMERSYLSIVNGNKLDNYSKETTPLNQIFGGYLRSEVACLVCHHVSTTFQHFQDLLLDIRTASSVEDALEAYFSRERLGDGDQAYRCEQCNKRVAATKKFTIERPPKALCIALKRFGAMGGKNSKAISVKEHLDISKFRHRGGEHIEPLRYKLVSLVTHLGPSSSCGHYTAVGQSYIGSYYLFDDNSVRPLPMHGVLNTNAYIIMYEMETETQIQKHFQKKESVANGFPPSNGEGRASGSNLVRTCSEENGNGLGVQSSQASQTQGDRTREILGRTLANKAAMKAIVAGPEHRELFGRPASAKNTTGYNLQVPANKSLSLHLHLQSNSLSSQQENQKLKETEPSSVPNSSPESKPNQNGVSLQARNTISPVRLVGQGKARAKVERGEGDDSCSPLAPASTSASPSPSRISPSPQQQQLDKVNIPSLLVQKSDPVVPTKAKALIQGTHKKPDQEIHIPSKQSPQKSQLNISAPSPGYEKDRVQNIPLPSTPEKKLEEKMFSSSEDERKSSPGFSLVPYLSESSESEGEFIPPKPSLSKESIKTGNSRAIGSTVVDRSSTQRVRGVRIEVEGWETGMGGSSMEGRRSELHSPAGSTSSGKWSVTSTERDKTPEKEDRAECIFSEKSESRSSSTSSVNRNDRWDGSRNNSAVNHLLQTSHRGYGAPVNSWSGGRSEMDIQVEGEKTNLKRSNDSYNDEFDRGKAKKVKKYNNHNSPNGGSNNRNRFQEFQNRKNVWQGGNNRQKFYRDYVDNRAKPRYYFNRNSSRYWE